MGTRKKFSAEEQELLRANSYTEKVTENQISSFTAILFSVQFKKAIEKLPNS